MTFVSHEKGLSTPVKREMRRHRRDRRRGLDQKALVFKEEIGRRKKRENMTRRKPIRREVERISRPADRHNNRTARNRAGQDSG